MPDVGNLYRLNLGPCWAVLPLVVDFAVVDAEVDVSEGDRRPKTNRLAPGKGCPDPFPEPLFLLLPPLPLDLPFPFPPPALRPLP